MIKKPARMTEDEYKALPKAEKDEYDKVKTAWEAYLNDEDSESRFERVIKPRLATIIGNMKNIEKMVKSPNYAVDEQTLEKICETLHTKVDLIKLAYQPKNKEEVKNEVDEMFTS